MAELTPLQFVLYRTGLIIYRLYFHPLSKYPGPKYLAVSGLPHLYLENIRGLFYRDVRELHNKYGNIVRVGPNEICVDGSIGWNDAYGHRKAGQAEFGKDRLFYRPMVSQAFSSTLSVSESGNWTWTWAHLFYSSHLGLYA